MPHIIFYDQNISLKYATSNTKEPKNKKFIINLEWMPWNEKINVWWPLGIKVQVQQQRSLIMIMKNIVQEIFYNEQNYTS
jgi:hypothetical protein